MNEIRQLFDVAKMVKSERLNQGLTQAELSSRASVSRRWLIGLEQGEVDDARFGNLMKVLTALDIQLQAKTSSNEPSKPHLLVEKDYLGPLRMRSSIDYSSSDILNRYRVQVGTSSPQLSALEMLRAQNHSQVEKYLVELAKAPRGETENNDD